MKKVLVTGSGSKSRFAWGAIRLIYAMYGIKPTFVSAGDFYAKKEFDALIISGGEDIDPSTYGSRAGCRHRCDKKRDLMELTLLEKALEKKAPILGICRGMQLINVFFKGTLHYDIKGLDLPYPHPHTPLPLKTVYLKDGSVLKSLAKRDTIRVNALHRQAIEKPGENIKATALDRNSIIQAIEHERYESLIGVQWHPEFMPYSAISRKIFRFLIARPSQTRQNIRREK